MSMIEARKRRDAEHTANMGQSPFLVLPATQVPYLEYLNHTFCQAFLGSSKTNCFRTGQKAICTEGYFVGDRIDAPLGGESR